MKRWCACVILASIHPISCTGSGHQQPDTSWLGNHGLRVVVLSLELCIKAKVSIDMRVFHIPAARILRPPGAEAQYALPPLYLLGSLSSMRFINDSSQYFVAIFFLKAKRYVTYKCQEATISSYRIPYLKFGIASERLQRFWISLGSFIYWVERPQLTSSIYYILCMAIH